MLCILSLDYIEENEKPADLSQRIVFKSKKGASSSDKDTQPSDKDTQKLTKNQPKVNKSKLSFQDEDDDEED